jgi:hypothetical protein
VFGIAMYQHHCYCATQAVWHSPSYETRLRMACCGCNKAHFPLRSDSHRRLRHQTASPIDTNEEFSD